MHGDNIPLPKWCETLQQICEAADSSVGIVCASYEVFEDGKTKNPGDSRGGNEIIHGSTDSILGTIKKGCWWHNSCTAIRKDLFLELGGFPTGMRQKGDWDFLLRFLSSGHSISYIQKPLMKYREHSLSASGFAFQRNLDLEEGLQVLLKYASISPIPLLIKYHSRNFFILCRRFGRSLLQWNWQRAKSSFLMQIRNLSSLISCCVLRLNR